MTSIRLEGLTAQEELAAAGRSAVYRYLAEALAFPTRGLSEAVASGRFLEELLAAGAEVPFPVPVDGGLEAQPALTFEEMEGEYIRLFEVGPGRPPCPLYEGSHRRGRKELLEDLVRFFEHFGLRHEEGDLPDHLCAELEFMHYLAFKEAAALRAGTDSQPYRLAQRDFLDRHLNRWLPALRARLEKLDPPRFYASILRLTDEICRGLSQMRWGKA